MSANIRVAGEVTGPVLSRETNALTIPHLVGISKLRVGLLLGLCRCIARGTTDARLGICLTSKLRTIRSDSVNPTSSVNAARICWK